jgi:hypothetical protein
MTLGVDIRSRLARVPRGLPVNTATLFVAGPANTGSTDAAVEIRSLADFEAEFGTRGGTNGNTATYDYVDAAFGEGVNRLFVSRRATTDTDFAPALARFDEDLGPGQIALVGDASSEDYVAALEHARDNNRFALLDVAVDDVTVADLTAQGDIFTALAGLTEFGMLSGPWIEIPPPPSIIGATARQVPGSAAVAGLIARADASGFPSRAAAGRDFPLQYATGVVSAMGKQDRETVLNAGVNPIAMIYGVLENYGFQTGVEQQTDNPYWQANCARTRMWIVAQARAVAEPFVFRTIDGQGKLANALGSAIDSVLLSLYEADGLYGATAGEAFATTVGASVNTTDTVAQGELHAVSEVRYTQHAKSVFIDLVTVPITGSIAP